MCGFAGFWNSERPLADPEGILRKMTKVMFHRGPDEQRTMVEGETGLGLCFSRLSIIDLSVDGSQPMESASGRFVLAFNGEVYNFRELRAELDVLGDVFRGHSDTEVMLAAIERWGLEPALSRFNGMFAFALWDRRDLSLHLVRDRMGIKPLYYGFAGDTLVFGSDPAAFRPVPGFAGEVDRGSLSLYLRHGYVPTPYSIFSGIRKLMPGHLVSFYGIQAGSLPDARPFWSARDAVEMGGKNPFPGSPDEAVTELETLLRDAVTSRMVSDVPLGAFLSGGVDSSTVVALMQQGSDRPVRTFSIGFEEEEFNEATYAADVARHLGTEHTELYVTSKDCRDVVPLLPEIFSEPFADSSQIPTYLVSRLARSQVTVSLSGDGGDELFAGYHQYAMGQALWRRTSRIPKSLRAVGGEAIRMIPIGGWDVLLKSAGSFRSGGRAFALTGDRMHKLAEVASQPDFPSMYRALVSAWRNPSGMVVGGFEPPTLLSGLDADAPGDEVITRMMYWDLRSYLPDDILTKVDRASMAVSLEARVPLLDHRVVELAWRLPMEFKRREGLAKWVLREVLVRHVPARLIDRPKRGFGVPLESWLKGPLRDWAEALLDRERLVREGFFHADPIRKSWREFQSGKRRWHSQLWIILMFQAWLEHRGGLAGRDDL